VPLPSLKLPGQDAPQSLRKLLRWNRRWSLWISLVALVAAMLATLVWLAGRYEASLVQSRLERDVGDIGGDIRLGLTRNIQSLQALGSNRDSNAWRAYAAELMRQRRELIRIEWRNAQMTPLQVSETPYRPPVFERMGRDAARLEVNLACSNAVRLSRPAYGSSYFLPQRDGLGLELLEICLPEMTEGKLAGYTVATYSLQEILSEMAATQVARGQGLSFTEPDGTRLAMTGTSMRGNRVYTAQQLLDLPGATLVLRLDSWKGTPDFFPNMLTALVSAMSLALMAVLLMLGRDMRRRLKVESDLAEALAFRKAMEDSLVTGLRARDLQGRITYVNPAFCKMVGVEAKELLNHGFPSPYWPPELAGMYQDRQTLRLAGVGSLPRSGHESVFMRRDGTRFPVLIIEAPLINAAGKHTGWMSAILDISEQKRIEELSRASQDRLQATARLAMVGEMASLLSHELNQPLAAASSYATGSLNLLDDAAEASPLHADLRLALTRIAEQAERAGRVIKSVHDFVRRRDQVREKVAPAALLEAIMPLVTLQARKLAVRVEIEIDAHCTEVLCDRTMVEQVLLNLSRNGMQAMQQDAALPADQRVLTLAVRPAEAGQAKGWLAFSVTDRGAGIAPEVAEKLFTPFFTTKVEGMGLGLSLCRTVIEQHGGYMGFEPALPRGTVFMFTLPTGRVPGPAPDRSPASREPLPLEPTEAPLNASEKPP
jgi:two-component system sensor histidine kinase DctS